MTPLIASLLVAFPVVASSMDPLAIVRAANRARVQLLDTHGHEAPPSLVAHRVHSFHTLGHAGPHVSDGISDAEARDIALEHGHESMDHESIHRLYRSGSTNHAAEAEQQQQQQQQQYTEEGGSVTDSPTGTDSGRPEPRHVALVTVKPSHGRCDAALAVGAASCDDAFGYVAHHTYFVLLPPTMSGVVEHPSSENVQVKRRQMGPASHLHRARTASHTVTSARLVSPADKLSPGIVASMRDDAGQGGQQRRGRGKDNDESTPSPTGSSKTSSSSSSSTSSSTSKSKSWDIVCTVAPGLDARDVLNRWVSLESYGEALNLVDAGATGSTWTLHAASRRKIVTRGLTSRAASRAIAQWISRRPETYFVADRPRGLRALSNEQTSWVIQSGIPAQRPLWDMGIDGSGEIVSVADTGVDPDHCMFADPDRAVPVERVDLDHRKIVHYHAFSDTIDQHGHGTHVAGTIAGQATAASEQRYPATVNRGMAHAAKLSVFDMSTGYEGYLDSPEDLSVGLFDYTYFATESRIFSASWGEDSYDYGDFAFETDSFAHAHPEWLPVFACGNDGETGANDGAFQIVSPATSKNGVAVAANEESHLDRIAPFSSTGPTLDARMKPDIVVPGQNILSAQASAAVGNCDFSYKSGTSMACPAASGAAALVRHFFRGGFYAAHVRLGGRVSTAPNTEGFTPTAALVKAALVHAGQTLRGTFTKRGYDTVRSVTLHETPDPYQGFGMLVLDRVFPVAGLAKAGAENGTQPFGLYVEDVKEGGATTTGGSDVLCFDIEGVSDGSEYDELRATLSWTDPASSVTSHGALINDLDLTVTYAGDPSIYHTGNEDLFRESGGLMRKRQNDGSADETFNAFGDADPLSRPSPTASTTRAATATEVNAQRDALNNMERVKIPSPRRGRWIVSVRGTHVPMGPQPYALVVTGPFDGPRHASRVPCEPPCPNTCGGRGICSKGVCTCDPGFSGPDCTSASLDTRTADTPLRVRVGAYEWSYFSYELTPADLETRLTLGVTMKTLNPAADPDLFVSFGTAPTLHGYMFANTSTATVQRVDIGAEEIARRGPGVWHIGVFAFCCGPDTEVDVQAVAYVCPEECDACFRGTCAKSAASRGIAPAVAGYTLLAVLATVYLLL